MSFRAGIGTALVALAASASATADGVLILDLAANSSDSLWRISADASNRTYAAVRTEAQRCGVFALDAQGALLSTFASGGRLLDACVDDMRANDDGTLLEIESARLVLRTATGAAQSTSALVYPPVPVGSRSVEVFTVQADGRIIVGGGALTGAIDTRFKWFLTRLNTDHTLDTSFGNAGIVILDIGPGSRVRSVHALAGGKILASGGAEPGFGVFTHVARFDANGALDQSFGAAGSVQLPDGAGVTAVDGMGRIYVPRQHGGIARLTENGAVDATYDNDAISPGVTISTLALDSQGRAVLFGQAGNDAGYVARFDTSGDPDAGFSGDGDAEVDFDRGIAAPLGPGIPVCRGALHTGDRPLIVCSVAGVSDPGVPAHADIAFARLTASGALDATFADGQPDSDTYPDAFAFPDVTVPFGAANVVSAPATITGINGTTNITGAEHSVGCTGTFVDGVSTVAPGETVCARQHASATPGGIRDVDVNVGGRVARFRVISSGSPADSVPDAFSFTAQTAVAVGTPVVSNTVTIAGITGFASVAVQNGEFSVGCDSASFRTTTVDVTNGAALCVRHTSASTPGVDTSTQLTVGGISATFTSTTVAADTAPDAFTFTDQTGVATGAPVVSNAVTIAGINTGANVTVSGGEYSIGCNATFTAQPGTIQPGETVCVRHVASSQSGSTVGTTLTIGGVSDSFSSTTASSSGGSGSGSLDRWLLACLALLAILCAAQQRRPGLSR